ncbi:uncharacterized protein BDZ99DRAFT_468580 [Mytilinidion resinicola]|uniref:Uncharacterized protein n=1 Tax=Mytilinidion resinicola TaxID=574789 RepID=A0A6A6Y2A3_9PEZI|nr:uncharacterized protein BDZ99DRAFT_468580 [Mytilinidion resinicola]KAF2802912.1 hypothetical protein BDZ99DRAFT_468580 [Mytilinidion resinicola]
MTLLGKKFPAPIAKPMAPFYIAGVVVLYGINSFANVLAGSMFTLSLHPKMH